jgi:hypothetical protein
LLKCRELQAEKVKYPQEKLCSIEGELQEPGEIQDDARLNALTLSPAFRQGVATIPSSFKPCRLTKKQKS